MKQSLYSLSNFLFPALCPVCRDLLTIPGEIICLNCEARMPFARYTPEEDNPVSMLFWGRTRIERATSLFRFEKGSAYQPLLHELKYKGKKETGIFLGKMLGRELLQTPFMNCTCLVPVPLHPKKHKKRGFNQSEVIAEGVSSITRIPVNNNLLYRVKDSATQTNKSRFERYKNVSDVFGLTPLISSEKPGALLLIDDVVTTGSTLEACAEVLLKYAPTLRIFIATVACA